MQIQPLDDFRKYDVSNPSIKSSLMPIKMLESKLNSFTILRGARTPWDAERLKAGMHRTLAQIGAEHVQLISPTKEMVDAHFLGASNFFKTLEELGGERKRFYLNIAENNVFKHKKVSIRIGRISLDAYKIDLPENIRTQKYGIRDIEMTFRHLGKELVKDDRSGAYYVVDLKTKEIIENSEYCIRTGTTRTFEGLQTSDVQSDETDSIFKNKKILIHIGNVSVCADEIDISDKNLDGDTAMPSSQKLTLSSIDILAKNEIGALCKRIGKELVKDEHSQKYYLIDFEAKKIIEKARSRQDIKQPQISDFRVETKEKNSFEGFVFPKNNSKWEIVAGLLEKLKIYRSSWDLYENNDALYLVPRRYIGALEVCFGIGKKPFVGSDGFSLTSESVKHVKEMDRGTVLLTVNQSDIYEKYTHEMLTFVLEGVNVMGYNNPGKGLSTGSVDNSNINASIEAAYRYLTDVRNIPDKKILAKGQCFGGAPTAWLGKEHPNINLMFDQNPANFQDVVIEAINLESEKLEKSNWSVLRFSGYLLKQNRAISKVVNRLFSHYDIPRDIKSNKGNKLIHINVPDKVGIGGDTVVPEEHPSLMLAAASSSSLTEKKVALSFDSGGTHVTDWWISNESYNTVTNFLEKTGLRQSR